MKITSVRVRAITSNKYIAIASITLDDELIINDIRVSYVNGTYQLTFPNSARAQRYGQYSILPYEAFYVKAKEKIVDCLLTYY